MKKRISILLALTFILTLLVACSEDISDEPVDALDIKLFDSPENSVPIGQWVSIHIENVESNEFEPIYIRFVRVIRDQTEVQLAIDSTPFPFHIEFDDYVKKINELASDVEFRILEVEVHFPQDFSAYYCCCDYFVGNINFSELGDFSHIRAMTRDGDFIRSEYEELITARSGPFWGTGTLMRLYSDRLHNWLQVNDIISPGDTVIFPYLFHVLINFDECDYVFDFSFFCEFDIKRRSYFSAS